MNARLGLEEYPTYDSMIETLLKHQFLPEADVLRLCDRARALISEESNVTNVRSPVTVVGDIHGQFHGWVRAGYELLVFGRLRRSWVLFGGNGHVSGGVESPISRSGDHNQRKPRESTDYASVWILRRVHEKIRPRGDLESVYGFV